MKNIIKISCLIIATIIGAGFSSGREIYTFFNLYKENIVLILLTSFFMFYLTIYYILKLSYNKKVESYSLMIENIFGSKLKKIIETIFNIFLLIIFSIMVSGFGEFLKEILGIQKIWGSIILIILCFITLLKNIEGIMKISTLIVPIIILAIIILFIAEINSNHILIKNNIQYINYFSGIIYASYNLVIAIPVIISSSKIMKKSNEIKYISFISSLILIFLIIIIYYILKQYEYLIKDIAMPLLYISKLLNPIIYYIYICIILLSIYTTAMSTQYSLVQKYNKHKYKLAIFITGILGIMISFISFNKLISICFPVIGIVGLAQTIYIIYICKKTEKEK